MAAVAPGHGFASSSPLLFVAGLRPVFFEMSRAHSQRTSSAFVVLGGAVLGASLLGAAWFWYRKRSSSEAERTESAASSDKPELVNKLKENAGPASVAGDKESTTTTTSDANSAKEVATEKNIDTRSSTTASGAVSEEEEEGEGGAKEAPTRTDETGEGKVSSKDVSGFVGDVEWSTHVTAFQPYFYCCDEENDAKWVRDGTWDNFTG